MKKLVLTILALIALFSALRAYTESVSPPGVVAASRPRRDR